MIPRLLLVLTAAAALAGCDDRADASPAPDAAPPPTAAPVVTGTSAPSASPSGSGSAAGEKGELKALKLVFTSEVKNKEPVDKLDSAKAGQRVWAHLTMRNRTAETQPIALVFRVNGEERSRVDLKIDPSWSYRTWAFNTLRAGDASGELVAEVRDGEGKLISSARLPIKVEGAVKPQGKRPAPPGGD